MEEYKYKIEFDYDVNKHVKIISKINKKNKPIFIVGLIGAIIFYIGFVISSIKEKHTDTVLLVLSILFIFLFAILISNNSKKTIRNKLLKIYGNDLIKFTYEFYDDYVRVYRTGKEFTSDAKMKYSNLINVELVEDNLGYISTKDRSLIFLSGDQVKEIYEFVNYKIVRHIQYK